MVQYFDNGDLACANGLSFRRDKKTGYFLSSSPIGGRRKRLHVYVWELIHGEIPKGYQVHHIDHDKNNNEPENLALLTVAEHRKIHSQERTEEQLERMRRNVAENVRPKAIEWHKSAAGRAWHAEVAKKNSEKWEYRTYTCTYCGKEFQSRKLQRNSKTSFCSNNCKSAYRRKMGYDNVTRKCIFCGGEFIVNKYAKTQRCKKCKYIKNRA